MLGTWLMERKFNIDRMYIEALQVIGFILFSSVKFFFAPSTVYLVGYSYFETVAITVTGGILGVFVFSIQEVQFLNSLGIVSLQANLEEHSVGKTGSLFV